MEVPVCKVQSRKRKTNHWVHKTGTSVTYFDESSSMESVKKTTWLRSGRT